MSNGRDAPRVEQPPHFARICSNATAANGQAFGITESPRWRCRQSRGFSAGDSWFASTSANTRFQVACAELHQPSCPSRTGPSQVSLAHKTSVVTSDLTTRRPESKCPTDCSPTDIPRESARSRIPVRERSRKLIPRWTVNSQRMPDSSREIADAASPLILNSSLTGNEFATSVHIMRKPEYAESQSRFGWLRRQSRMPDSVILLCADACLPQLRSRTPTLRRMPSRS